MNILNRTNFAVFLYCRFSLFLKDLFFKIFLGKRTTRKVLLMDIVPVRRCHFKILKSPKWCKLVLNKAIGIINFAKTFLNFIDDTMI